MPPVKRKRDLSESADYDLPAAKRAKVEPEETNCVEVTEERKKSKSATENLATDTDNIRKRKRSASEPADHGYKSLENERRAKRAQTAEPEATPASRPQDAESRVSIEEKDVSRAHIQEAEKEGNVETEAEPRGHEQKKAMNVEEEDVLKVQRPERVEKCDMSRVQGTENKAIAEKDVQEPEKKDHVNTEENPANVNENEIAVEEKEGSAKASETSIVEETKLSASSGWASYGASSTSAFAKAAGSASIFGSVPASKPVYSFGAQRGVHEAEECANDCDTSTKSNNKGPVGRAFDTYAESGGFAGLASQPSTGSGFPGQEKEWSGESPKASNAFKPENSNGPVANEFGARTPLGSGFAGTFGTPSGFTASIPNSTSGFQTQATFGCGFAAALGAGSATPLGTPSAFTQSPLDSGFASPFGTSSEFATDLGGGFATLSPFGNSSVFAASVSPSTCGFQTQTPFSSGFATPLGTSSAFTTPLSTQSGFTTSAPSPTSGFQTRTPFDTPSRFATSATKSTCSFGFGSQEKNDEKVQSFNPFGPFQPDNSNGAFATGFNSYRSPGSSSGFGGDSTGSGRLKEDEGSGGYGENLGTSEGEDTGGKGKETGAFGSQAAFGTWSGFGGGVSFGAGGQESFINPGTSRPANGANGFGSYASEKSYSFGNGERGPSVFGSKASGLGTSTPEWSFNFDDDTNVDDYPYEDPDSVYERVESPKDEKQRTSYNYKPEKGYLKDGKIRMPDYYNIMTREEKESEYAWTNAELAEERRTKLKAEQKAKEAEKNAKEVEKNAKEVEKNAKEAAVKAKAAEEMAKAKAKAAEVRARADESTKRRWNEYYGEDLLGNATHEYIGWGLDSGEFFSKSNCEQVRAGQKGCPFPKINSARCRLGADECVKAQTLRVCQHDLLRVLKGSNSQLVEKIKAERNRWHPDKINHRMGHNGKRWEVHAKEMFQMLVALAKKKE